MVTIALTPEETKSSGPASCRIGRRDKFGRDVAAPKAASSKDQILLNGSACGSQGQPFLALDALLPVGGLDQAGINRKAFAANQSLFNAALQHCLKDAPLEIALAETAMPVLREGGMIGDMPSPSRRAESEAFMALRQTSAELPQSSAPLRENRHSKGGLRSWGSTFEHSGSVRQLATSRSVFFFCHRRLAPGGLFYGSRTCSQIAKIYNYYKHLNLAKTSNEADFANLRTGPKPR
jgi:hypothetical protein